MKSSELLLAMASWLESPENEALMLVDDNDLAMSVVAESCIKAANILKQAAEDVSVLEPLEESKLTNDSIDKLASIAKAFDESGDDELKTQASVIDELLLTIAVDPNEFAKKMAEKNYRLEELKKKYQEPSERLKELNKVSDSLKAIKDSPYSKEYKPLEAPLSARTCPDHPGAQIARVGEHVWQCSLDKKIYNFESGFETNKGSKVPGTSVSEQTKFDTRDQTAIFDTRESRLNSR